MKNQVFVYFPMLYGYDQMEQYTCNIYNAIVEQYNNTMIHRHNNVHIINNTLQQYQYQCGATIQHCACNISNTTIQ